MKKLLSVLFITILVLAVFTIPAYAKPLTIHLYYPNNPAYPFNEEWASIKEIEKQFDVDLVFEVIPMDDYQNKVSDALSSKGNKDPDVILYQNSQGANANYAINGAILPISDYKEWTPNFNARVSEFGRKNDIERVKLIDGKLYYLPSISDYTIYESGLILREDYLNEKGFRAPKSYDDLYNILSSYKKDFPDSTPLTLSGNLGEFFAYTMPSFGISLGDNSSSTTSVLSWDYIAHQYFNGAISDQYKVYLEFISKLYAEGLLDFSMTSPSSSDNNWKQKMADGKAMATYTYFSDISEIESLTTIENFILTLYPPLKGPAGAYHIPKNTISLGLLFPSDITSNPNFEKIVRKVDEIFFSNEAKRIWTIGVKGKTYTEKNGEIIYSDSVINDSTSIFKTLQKDYGCGILATQLVWKLDLEMSQRSMQFMSVNLKVANMRNSVQYVPPAPLFDNVTAMNAATLLVQLNYSFNTWSNSFITGKRSIENDWDKYVTEMKQKGIEEFCEYFNQTMYIY